MILEKKYDGPTPETFPLGSIVNPKGTIRFCDGTSHKFGDKITVTEENHAYFCVCSEAYTLVKWKHLTI